MCSERLLGIVGGCQGVVMLLLCSELLVVCCYIVATVSRLFSVRC